MKIQICRIFQKHVLKVFRMWTNCIFTCWSKIILIMLMLFSSNCGLFQTQDPDPDKDFMVLWSWLFYILCMWPQWGWRVWENQRCRNTSVPFSTLGGMDADFISHRNDGSWNLPTHFPPASNVDYIYHQRLSPPCCLALVSNQQWCFYSASVIACYPL